MSPISPESAARPEVGLCAQCRHMRTVRSDRGSVFYRCERSRADARFPAYPRLPVAECAGFEEAERRGLDDGGRAGPRLA
jgi:hypothetical protein